MKKLGYLNLVLFALIFSLCSFLTVSAFAAEVERPLPALTSGEISPFHEKVKPAEPTEAQKVNIKKTYGKLPLYFIENKGQVDGQVSFYERGAGHATFFTEDGVVFSLSKREAEADKPSFNKDILGLEKEKSAKATSEAVSLSFVGANKDAKITSNEKMPGHVNYFVGNDKSKWRSNIPTYGAVTYENVYKNIDIKFYGNNKNIEHDVIVRPGGDFSKVKFAYKGIQGLKVTETGDLEVTLTHGKIIEKKPVIYQEIKGERVAVDGSYRILKGEGGAFTYGFTVASYDKTKDLVIDPMLAYSTYLGGSGDELGYGIAVDSSGAVYVTGWTDSSDFPLMNPIQGTYGGGLGDAFITKINSAGTGLVYSTYLGGTGDDFGNRIAVDGSGAAYVTGGTHSTDFPIMNPIQGAYGGGGLFGGDAFITKIDPAGTALVYSTYLGGSGDESGDGIAVDSNGAVYVIGYTDSTDFPLMNPIQGIGSGSFITKINSSGTALVYSTFFGGWCSAIAVDALGNAYVTGLTFGGLPLVNPIQGIYGGGVEDAFITKINSSGTALVYSTYLGGSLQDVGEDIAVDNTGAVYITGYAGSEDFPLVNPIQATCGKLVYCDDVFVTKINSAGTALVYSTYLGGTDYDWGWGVAVDNTGAAYVTGNTSSTDFPLMNPIQGVFGGAVFTFGGGDAFVTKINPAGSAFVYSTYLGGSGDELGYGIAVDSAGAVYVTGRTDSSDFPLMNPIQGVNGGGTDAFITKISDTSPSVVTLTITPDAVAIARGSTLGYIVTATNTTAVQQCFDYWEDVTLPNGSNYPTTGALFGPVNLCLNAGASQTAHLTHGVPMSAPVGAYIFNAFVGTNPTPITSEAHFNFDVTAFGPATQNPQISWRLLENGFRK